MENDIVLDLKDKSFACRDIAGKRGIIKEGRPTPVLLKKVGRRSFQSKWYDQIDWLCASKSEEKLYCWPCLLFQPKSGHSWTHKGYSNYQHILKDSTIHAKSMNHLNNYKRLKIFGMYDIVTAISESAKLEKERHNTLVEENRKYLKYIVNAILYLCKQELPLRGHDEKIDSLNRGNYRELLHCFSKIDSVFASRLFEKEGSRHFSGVSNTIQKELISAIDSVIADVIHTEIESAPFISVQADETTDCAMHAQLSIIIRYVTGCKINERFLGFYDVSDDKSASRLADVIEIALNSFSDSKSKLVSQTYDGAAVMAGERNGVQIRLREKGFKYGDFIHCYAHKLNLVLSKSTEKVSGVKLFFSYLRSFSKFTSSSTKRKSVFRLFNINIPSLCVTRWCYKSRTVSAIKDNREKLINALDHILNHTERWDEETLTDTDTLLSKLNDFTFMFFINCFHVILSHAEKLFDILQCRQLDMKYAQEKINDFIQLLLNYSSEEHFENIVQKTMADIETPSESDPPPAKRTRGNQMNYKFIYFEIMQNIVSSLTERFANIEDFFYFELLDVEKFEVFAHTFPKRHIDALQEKYPDIFDFKSLTNELKYLYNDKDFKQCKSSKAILELLHELGFLSAMSETVRLIQLFLTIPATSVANERSFSTLDRIRSFLRCTMAQDRLSSLARISIEKQILIDLEHRKELHDKILDKFALKPRRLEFMFK